MVISATNTTYHRIATTGKEAPLTKKNISATNKTLLKAEPEETMKVLTQEELNEFFKKHRSTMYWVNIHGVIDELQVQGNIAIAKTFIQYCQKISGSWGDSTGAAYRGLVVLTQRGELSTEELDAFMEIAKKFWVHDMDYFFQIRTVLAHSKYVTKLLDVVEEILTQIKDGGWWDLVDTYWNAYTALFDMVCARHITTGKIKLDKARTLRLYESVQTIQPPENNNYIRLANMRDGLEALKEKIEALPE